MFRLSLALGYAHPDYLRPLLSLKQLRGWAAYYQLEPFGFEVEDARHSVSLAVACRLAGNKETKPTDFSMAQVEEDPEEDERRLDEALGIDPDEQPGPQPG